MTAASDRPMTEAERVEAWRFESLVRAGFSSELAEKLAESDADIHEAVALVAAGCPSKTAARILL